jgi:hypothetical protein
VAGYSGTPLVQKLGIKPGHRMALVNAPDDFAKTLKELPDGVVLDWRFPSAKRPPDGVVWFVSRRADLVRRLPVLRSRIAPASSLWVCWPKKASGVQTDMTEDAIRAVALPLGLVDNKVCAVDTTWSGLRLVIRLELRPSGKRGTYGPAGRRADGTAPGAVSGRTALRRPRRGAQSLS